MKMMKIDEQMAPRLSCCKTSILTPMVRTCPAHHETPLACSAKADSLSCIPVPTHRTLTYRIWHPSALLSRKYICYTPSQPHTRKGCSACPARSSIAERPQASWMGPEPQSISATTFSCGFCKALRPYKAIASNACWRSSTSTAFTYHPTTIRDSSKRSPTCHDQRRLEWSQRGDRAMAAGMIPCYTLH